MELSHVNKNPFHNQNIINKLGTVCTDKKVLSYLRELSTHYYTVLNQTYFNLVNIKLIISEGYAYTKSHEEIRKTDYHYCVQGDIEKRNLDISKWEPTIARLIRILKIDSAMYKYLEVLDPSNSININIYQLLIHQCSPFINILEINITFNSSLEEHVKFIQQFVNLKKITIIREFISGEDLSLADLEELLDNLNSSGIKIELRVWWDELEHIQLFSGSLKKLKNKIHSIGFDAQGLLSENEIEQFAAIIPEFQSIISTIELNFGSFDEIEITNSENILKCLQVFSPSVTKLSSGPSDFDIDFFSEIHWPNLANLDLCRYFYQLPDLSICCPKLETFTIESEEDYVFFSDEDSTFEDDLKHIFGGCAESLKKFKIVPGGPFDEAPRIIRDNHLHRFLQIQ